MEDNLFNLRKLPQHIIEQLGSLIVGRLGTDKTSYMITKDFIGYLEPGKPYQLVKVDPSLIQSKLYSDTYKGHEVTLLPCQNDANFPPPVNLIKRIDKHGNAVQNFTAPKHARLEGVWHKKSKIAKNNANILGGFGVFTDESNATVNIPVITATDDALAFYGAYLVKMGETIEFESQQTLPITLMEVGKTYIDNYIMLQNYGDGEYIEYHNEPHFWMPTRSQSKGFVLLGRHIDGVYYLTGFKIPFGCGMYASPFVIHADSFVVGEYLVVYTAASEYSTVILENKKNVPIKLHFYEP